MKTNTTLLFIFLTGLLFSFQIAITSYVNSSVIAEAVSSSSVGLFYSISALLGISIFLLSPYILTRIGNVRYSLLVVAISSLTLLGLSLSVSLPSYVVIGAFVLYLVANNTTLFTLDIFLEQVSEDKKTGRIRGMFLTAVNLGWLLAPLLAGKLAEINYSYVYIIACILTLPVLWLITTRIRSNFSEPLYEKYNLLKAFKHSLSSRSVALIMTSNLLLHIFYAIMVIYTPLYLHGSLNIPWSTLGIIFTIMLTPFSLFQYAYGYIADKFLGEKEILIFGFGCMSITTFLLSQSITISLVGITTLLFLSRVGASAVESMNESFFFKHIKTKDSSALGLFRATSPLAYIIAPLLATIILSNNIPGIFLILSGIMVIGAIMVGFLQDTK